MKAELITAGAGTLFLGLLVAEISGSEPVPEPLLVGAVFLNVCFVLPVFLRGLR